MAKIPTTQFGVTLPEDLIKEIDSLVDGVDVQSKSQYISQAIQFRLAQDRAYGASRTGSERSYKDVPLKQLGLRIPTSLVSEMDDAIDGIAYINRSNFVVSAIVAKLLADIVVPS